MAKKQAKKINFKKLSNEELAASFDDDWDDPTISQWKFEMDRRPVPLAKRFERYLTYAWRTPIIKHPFYTGHCNPSQAFHVNYSIEWKEQEAKRQAEKGDWHKVIFLYATPHLLDGFKKYHSRFDDKSYWQILATIWTLQEQLWPNRKLFLKLFEAPRDGRQWLMTVAERRKLENMPNQFPVYRGFIGTRGKGLSWTTDKKKAEWFAKRFAKVEGIGQPKLMEGIAKKKDVLAYFNGRKEKEIVIDPDKVTKVKTSAIAFDPEEEIE